MGIRFRKTFVLKFDFKLFAFLCFISNISIIGTLPAKPGVLFIRAKPYVISRRITPRKYGLTAVRVLLPAARKRA